MVISEVSLRTSGIDILSGENFVLMLESNANVINKFTTAAMTNLETQKIMRVVTSSSKSSSAINHHMVQSRWGIHPHLQRTWMNAQCNRESKYHAPTHH